MTTMYIVFWIHRNALCCYHNINLRTAFSTSSLVQRNRLCSRHR